MRVPLASLAPPLTLGASSVLAILALLSCFTGRDPLYCDGDTPCQSASRPICDLDGEFAGGLGNTCVANPFAECSTDFECTDALAPICEAGQCWPCTVAGTVSADACETRRPGAPVCSASGACVECSASSDCGDELPICDEQSQTCVACDAPGADSSACMSKDPDAAMCSSSGVLAGRCVECTPATEAQDCSDPSMPVCGDDGRCGACADHGDCDSGICDRDSGACVEAGHIVYVDDAAGLPGPSCGATSGPGACEELGDALALVGVPPARVWIKLSEGIHDATGDNVISIEDDTVRFVGESSETTRLSGNDVTPVISIGDGATVTFDHVEVRGGTDGISCVAASTASTLTLERSVVNEADEDGIEATNCSVTVEQSSVRDNDGHGILMNSGELSIQRSRLANNSAGGVNSGMTTFSIRNNFIHGNGTTVGTPSIVGGVRIIGGSGELEFNTIARNGKSDSGTAAGVDCDTSTNVPVANNIVWGNLKATSTDDVQINGTCDWSHSTIQDGATGTNILSGDPMFVNPDGENFHLQSGSPCEGVADPAATLTIDFNGDERPLGSGRNQGADEIDE